jgi:hypothetical protein
LEVVLSRSPALACPKPAAALGDRAHSELDSGAWSRFVCTITSLNSWERWRNSAIASAIFAKNILASSSSTLTLYFFSLISRLTIRRSSSRAPDAQPLLANPKATRTRQVLPIDP